MAPQLATLGARAVSSATSLRPLANAVTAAAPGAPLNIVNSTPRPAAAPKARTSISAEAPIKPCAVAALLVTPETSQAVEPASAVSQELLQPSALSAVQEVQQQQQPEPEPQPQPHHHEPAHSVAESVYSSAYSDVQKDHNSVTIKNDTSVKDAAGAVVKVLNRLTSAFVTAMRLEASHEAVNRAVKALAVSRKYVKDAEPELELGFLPLNRSNCHGMEDPSLFAFLAFKAMLAPGISLKEHDETDLNVSTSSDPNSMANAIIRIVKERGQAVMKAGGGNALFVAMTAVINARRRLKRNHDMDVMLVPQWITEDTRAQLGRESKFLRMNILPCGMNGVGSGSVISLIPVQPHHSSSSHHVTAGSSNGSHTLAVA